MSRQKQLTLNWQPEANVRDKYRHRAMGGRYNMICWYRKLRHWEYESACGSRLTGPFRSGPELGWMQECPDCLRALETLARERTEQG